MVNASESILILVQVEMLPAQVLLERHWGLGRDFMAKIAASSMKSPIFTATRAYIELSLACGSLDSRGVLCQKVGLCLLFSISQARIWDPLTRGTRY